MYSNMVLGDVFVVCHSMDCPGSLLTVEKFLERDRDNNVDDIYVVVCMKKWDRGALVPHSSAERAVQKRGGSCGKVERPSHHDEKSSQTPRARISGNHTLHAEWEWAEIVSGKVEVIFASNTVNREDVEDFVKGYTNAKFDKFVVLKGVVVFVGCCQGVGCCEGRCPEDCTLKTDTKRTAQERTPSWKGSRGIEKFFAHRTHMVQLFLRPSFLPCEGHQGVHKAFGS